MSNPIDSLFKSGREALQAKLLLERLDKLAKLLEEGNDQRSEILHKLSKIDT